jgi:hypothetical protein
VPLFLERGSLAHVAMSTTTKPVSRPIAVLKLPEYEVPLLLTVARAIVRAMTSNPRFPSPDPPLAKVQVAIDALTAAETATRTRAHGTVPLRDAKRLELLVLLQQLCAHVQAIADADVEQAVSTIESAGMSVKKERVLPVRVFAAKRGPVSGTVKLVAPRAGERAGYEWAYSTDGKKTWTALPFTVRASTLVTGLQPGSTVYFRYRVDTKDGAGDWSEPTSIIVE